MPISLPRKRESSPERGSKKGRAAAEGEEEKLDELLKKDIPTLWALLCRGEIKSEKTQGENEGENKSLICPNGACWSALRRNYVIKKLFIRNCYEGLYEAWMKNSTDEIQLIGGTSGIGKSMFIWYALFRLMDAFHKDENKDKKPLKFLWVTQTKGTYILDSDGGCVEKEDNVRCPERVDYCFIDMGEDFSFPKGLDTMSCLKTLVIAPFKSEDRGVPLLRRNKVRPTVFRCMPVWSKDEMEAVAKSLFGKSFNRKRFHALFLIFGGCLDSCLHAHFPTNVAKICITTNGHYGKACEDFVQLLETSAELKRDGIPEEVQGALEEHYIAHEFQTIDPILTGLESQDLDLRKIGSLIAHSISTGPDYIDEDIRVSSRFAELYILQYKKVRRPH